MHQRILTVGLFSFAIIACKPISNQHRIIDNEPSKATANSTSAQASAGAGAVTDKKSCLHVVGGVVTHDLPSVVLLIAGNQDSLGSCTGTFIGKDTILTASHCLKSTDPTEIEYLTGDDFTVDGPKFLSQVSAGIHPSKVLVHDPAEMDSTTTITSKLWYKDIALLIFDKEIAPAITPLARRGPTDGQPVTVIGYGRTSLTDTATVVTELTKRVGHNTLATMNAQDVADLPGIFLLRGPSNAAEGSDGPNALIGQGDSGGPMIVGTSVVGVASRFLAIESITDPTLKSVLQNESQSVYVDLGGSDAQDFFTKAGQQGAHLVYDDQVTSSDAPITGSTQPCP